MNFKHSIIRIFSANIISMISSIIINFVVPGVLSVNQYSLVKTYTFYISYIGLLHFGFIDGMYIKYGGKKYDDINKQEFKSEHNTFLILQGIMTLIILGISFIKKDSILFLMSISILPINGYSFHKLFYQATGQFKNYASYSSIYTIIYLLLNLTLAIFIKSKNYILYCLTTLISNYLVFIILEYKFSKETKGISGICNVKYFNNIKIGIFILIGNFSVIMFHAIDRWFIKLFYGLTEFGYYSFAMSMLNIVNLLVSSISITFYNYLSKGEDVNKLRNFKKYFIILGGAASLVYFALAAIISTILTKYNPALNIISISFACYPYMITINALYVNLYKARKDELKYFKLVVFMVIISIIFNVFALLFSQKPEFIALATTLSYVFWYFYSMKDFTYLKSDIKEIFYLFILSSSFLFFSHNFNWLIGGIGYLIVFVLGTVIVYIKELNSILKVKKLKGVK